MAGESDAVGQIFSERIRVVAPLSYPGEKLAFDERHIRGIEYRLHHAVGKDRPGGIEHFARRTNPEHRPVIRWRSRDLASEQRHLPAQRRSRILLRSPVGYL